MKVIFLDIDGVLNWIGTEDRYPTAPNVRQYIGLCEERIARFNAIIEAHPDAKIVISSTWRHSYTPGGYQNFDELVKLLKSRGLKGDIIGHTEFPEFRMSGWVSVGRGEEIRRWLNDYEASNEKLESFVILDDDTYRMDGGERERYVGHKDGEDIYEQYTDRELRGNHVVTHWDGDPNIDGEEGGLQPKHIVSAISILDGNPLPVPVPKKFSGSGGDLDNNF